MEAYKNFGGNWNWKLSEVIILGAILCMYGGMILAVLSQIIK
jgi:hypothetical protein